MKKLFIFLLFIFVCFPCFSATCTFTGVTDSHWNDNDNWDGDVPTTADDVVFNASSPSCLIDATAVAKTINCTGYVQTLTAGANLTVSGNITLVSGMTFTPSTYTVTVDAVSTIASGGKTFGAFTVGSSNIITLADDMWVTGTLTGYASGASNFAGAYNLHAQGNILRGGTGATGFFSTTTTLLIDGGANQTLGDATNNSVIDMNLVINKSGGTISSPYIVYFAVNNSPTFTYTAGAFDDTGGTWSLRANSTYNVSGMTFLGTVSPTISIAPTITLTSDMNVSGTFNTNTNNTAKIFTMNGYNVNCKGAIASHSSGYLMAGTTVIQINGTGNQIWKARWVCNNVNINKDSGTLTIQDTAASVLYYGNGAVTVTPGTWTWTKGVVTVTGTLNIYGTTADVTLDTKGGMAWNNIIVFTNSFGKLASASDVNGNFTLNAGSTLNAAGYQMNVAGNWTKNATATFTTGNNTVVFDGTSTLAGSTTFYNLTLNPGSTNHLTSTQTFIVGGIFKAEGTSGSSITLNATIADSQAILPVTILGNISYVTVTDIDSSGGVEIYDANGTLDNATNWTLTPPSITFDALLLGGD
ncbi:MAG: hypothetical protein WCI77_08110 [Candidatus Omnitrophota bacterium]